jgi:hypothetical protein
MHLSRILLRRLLGAVVLTCTVVCAPVVALVAPAGAVAPGCATAGLVVWLDTAGSGSTGSVYYYLDLTNLSGHTCTLYGYPAVSAVNLVGRQLGSAAHYHATTAPSLVTLANGESASAQVQIVDAGLLPAPRCAQAFAAGLRVYPPGQTTSKLAPYPFLACSRSGPVYLKVEPLQKVEIT